MDLYTILLWLLIALIATLGFAIESGIAARHKRVVLSSILSASAAAAYILFVVK